MRILEDVALQAGRIDPASAEYPGGKAKSGTVNTGTLFLPDTLNNLEGFMWATLGAAGTTPSGAIETALASDVLDSLIQITGDLKKDGSVAMTGDLDLGTNKVLNVAQGGIGPGPGNPNVTLSFEGSPTTGLTTVAPDTLYLIQDASNFSTAAAVVLSSDQAAMVTGTTSLVLLRGAEDSVSFRAGADEKLKLKEVSAGVATLDFFGRTSITNLPLGAFGPGGTNLSLSFNGGDDDGLVSTQAGRVALVAGIDNFSTAPTIQVDSVADQGSINVGSVYLRVNGDTHSNPNTIVFRTGASENMEMTATTLDLKSILRVENAVDPVNPQDYVTKSFLEGPAAPTGFTAVRPTYVADSDLAPTDINLSAIDDTFLTVGPTGSGASHIWTTLDALPLAAGALNLRMITRWSSSSTSNSFSVRTRINGGPASPELAGFTQSGVAGTTTAHNLSFGVLLDANNVFEIKLTAGDDSTISRSGQDLFLAGYSI